VSVPFATVLTKEHEHLKARRKLAAVRARLNKVVAQLAELMAKPEQLSRYSDLPDRVKAILEKAAVALTEPIVEPELLGDADLDKLVEARLKKAAEALTEPMGDSQGQSIADLHELVKARLKKAEETLTEPMAETPQSPPDDALKKAIDDAHVLKPFGVSFSGGGIRSATFNLGIIQGLAENGLLGQIDYLSTVSGGGYIGSWLHGFIKNHCAGSMSVASNRLSPLDNPVPGAAHDDPLAFLRKYSNYLAPSPGLFGADTWVIGTIWLRNVLLNQLILVPSLGALMLGAFWVYFVQQWPVSRAIGNIPYLAMPSLAVLLLAATLPFAIRNLSDIVTRCGLPELDESDGWQPNFLKAAWIQRMGRWFADAGPWVAPGFIFVAAVVLGCGDTGIRIEESIATFSRHAPFLVWLQSLAGLGILGLMFYAVCFALQTFGGFRRQYKHTHKDRTFFWFWKNAHPIWMSFAATVLLVGLLHLLWTHDRTWELWAKVTLAPPLVCLAIMAAVSLLIGLMGADYPDGAREWLARSGAYVALLSAGWVMLLGIAFYGPFAVAKGLGAYGKTTLTLMAVWIGTGGAGILAGRSAGTEGTKETGKSGPLDWLVAVAPPLVMVAYLLLISLGAHQAFAAWVDVKATSPDAPASQALQVDVRVPPDAQPVQISINGSTTPTRLERFFTRAGAFAAGYHEVFRGVEAWDGLLILTGMLLACVVVAWIASKRIDINEFSLHNFYKNRLVRCYLGASHARDREPNRFTGFDPRDDFALSLLAPDKGYYGPYPIINTTLNLNTGSELSQQERKGASFVLTPSYCGFEAQDKLKPTSPFDEFEDCGYRQTRESLDPKGELLEAGYSDPNGPTVGQAMAISGAAASPNSGYSTSAAMAFLLTIFDARLGWWLGNPRWKYASRLQGPSFALKYLIAELTANTTARTRFVNLSDGGHFENLGLYELVKRRCRYIIVCDGEQDGNLTFGSLGGAVRKCRADFGVEIDIDPSPIEIKDKTGRSGVHCVVGTIVYPEVDPAKPMAMTGASDGAGANESLANVEPATKYARGWLLYLKSSLTGNEPADVLEYQSENPAFPHQSTGDQFFSESQFESYRRLGLHVLREAFEGVMPTRKPGEWRPPSVLSLTNVFQQLTTKWYAEIPVGATAASDLNDEYSKLISRLSEDGLESRLDASLADTERPAAWQPKDTWPTRKQFVFIVEQLQLMENVFGEFEFEHRARRANPRNRGWMTIFKQWVKDPVFYEGVWPLVRHSYNPVFQKFIDRLHDEKIDDVPLQN
jgi:hypothetical protein